MKVSNGDSILYTPDPDFIGTDIFAYSICNNSGCDTALVTIVVLCVDPEDKNGIQGTVFNDLNSDGVEDSGEHGRENVQIYLYEDEDEDGTVSAGDNLIDSDLNQ